VSDDPQSRDAAIAAKQKLRSHLAGHPGVRGVGLTRRGEGYAVKVNLENVPEDDTLPTDVDGVPIIIDVVGTVKPR
jgi:hypothetical protein